MKNLSRICLALLVFCCIAGVQSAMAATEKVYATFENATAANNATWNGETKTFTWSGSWSNAIENIGLPTGDISGYEKLVVDCEIISGGSYRVLFYADGYGTTSVQATISESGKVEFTLTDYLTNEDYLLKCSGICLSGGNTDDGEVKVNEVYLETYDDEAVIDNTKKHASFANPTNRNTTWDSETRTFGWTSTGYNQLMNIGLPSGDISKYKKLVIDCTITSGESFRILFYDSQLSGNETLWITQSGVTEFNIKSSISESLILNCGQICLSGSNQVATGSVIINDLYLETYPEGESFNDIYLTAGMFQNWDGVDADAQQTGNSTYFFSYFESERNASELIYGNPNVSNLEYADLTGCSKLIIKGTPGVIVRTLWNRQSDNSLTELFSTIDNNGTVEVELTNLDTHKYIHLNAIKLANNSPSGIIERITFDGDFELVVTDGKNFTPNFKEYASATYTRTFNTAYDYGTICLPFVPDATTCANYTFYKLDQANANTLMFVEETEPKANTAYLYCLKEGVTADEAKTFTGSETEVSTEIGENICGDWNFIGSFKEQTIDLTAEGSFYAYKPDGNNGANKISKAINSMTIKPYRAYFHYTGTDTPATTMRMIIGGQNDGTTGIEEIITLDQIEDAVAPAIYDLMGRPVQHPVKGQIYIVNGQKVVY